MNLLFCIDRRCLGLLVTCLRSIARKGGYAHYDAYIFHSDLEQSDTAELDRALQGQVAFHFIPVREELFEGFPESDRYPRQIYYRLAAPLMLPQDVKRILYLDVDTVVINPLTELYEMDFEGNYYIGCTHTNDFLTKLNQARLRSDKAVAYINSGVLMMNLPALRDNLSLEAICQYAAHRKQALILPDQDILTALYGDKVKLVDTMVYNMNDRMLNLYNADISHKRRDVDWVRKNSVIIHYFGKNKPWKKDYSGCLDVFYRELLEA